MSFFDELKRRNTSQIANGNFTDAWLKTQVVETFFPMLDLSDLMIRRVTFHAS